MATLVNGPLPRLEDSAHDPSLPGGRPTTAQARAAGTPRGPVSAVKQCRVIITPWASGHCTVDIVSRCWSGAEHWDRRTGHLDLDIDPRDLSGASARDILRLLANAKDH